MFVARDVALSLGYKRPADAIQKHCKNAVKFQTCVEVIAKRDKYPDLQATSKMIPEGDVYRLIVRSKFPAAEEFERKLMKLNTSYNLRVNPLRNLDPDEYKTLPPNNTGGKQMFVLNESGLYSLILKSRKPDAKVFKKWVTSEVLPSIRKHGMYATPETVEQMLADPDTMIQTLTSFCLNRVHPYGTRIDQPGSQQHRVTMKSF